MSLDLILGLVFGTGGIALFTLVFNALDKGKQRKITDASTLHDRLIAENTRAQERADAAETDTDRVRQQRDDADARWRASVDEVALWRGRAIDAGWRGDAGREA